MARFAIWLNPRLEWEQEHEIIVHDTEADVTAKAYGWTLDQAYREAIAQAYNSFSDDFLAVFDAWEAIRQGVYDPAEN